MTFINEEIKEIDCKIVYHGCGLAGKSTNIECVYDTIIPKNKSKSIHIPLEAERAICCDFLPEEMYKINGYRLRYHLYTVPGGVFYDVCRLIILKNVDGIIFVADSQIERMDANIESLWNLQNYLKDQGDNLMTIPYALQLNKRDLPNILTVDELKKELIRKDEPVFEAVAYKGIGVLQTFKSVATQILQNIQNGNIQQILNMQ